MTTRKMFNESRDYNRDTSQFAHWHYFVNFAVKAVSE